MARNRFIGDLTVPTAWREPIERDHFDISYTTVGGSVAGEKPIKATGREQIAIKKLRSQVLVAVTPGESNDEDIQFFCAIARKILQRGSNPLLPLKYFEKKEAQDLGPILNEEAAAQDVFRTVAEDMETPELDSATSVHEVYEKPVWESFLTRSPLLSKFITPQATIASLIGGEIQDQRVDFLISAPWATQDYVCEIDGEQHSKQKSVDAERDRVLTESGYKVLRIAGKEAVSELTKFAIRGEKSLEGNYRPGYTKAFFLPGVINRLALAIVELIARGHLPTGTARLQISSDLGMPPSLVKNALKLLADIDNLWNLKVVPKIFEVGTVKIDCGGGNTKRGVSSVFIDLEYKKVALAPLNKRDLPTCVIRSVFVPNELPPLDHGCGQRRILTTSRPQSEKALHGLVEAIFGFEEFHPKQLEAIYAALSGHDSLVLLPTGGGKSLIYQMAGLLQPGVTIVIDPLKALIDDQVRNLQLRGIENVAGLHSGQKKKAEYSTFTQDLINSGVFLLLVAPERLQTPLFRISLRAIAETSVVNLAVLDEAHCVSEWGHDFRVAYLNVANNLRKLGASRDGSTPPILGLTGTASPAVLRDVKREVEGARELLVIEPDSFKRKNLHYRISGSNSPIFDATLAEVFLGDLPQKLGTAPATKFNSTNFPAGIVFVPTVNDFSGILSTKKSVFKALSFKGEERADEVISIFSGSAPREENYSKWEENKSKYARRFIEDESPIMVATKAFGMGIDKPNIRWTFHRGFPASIEAFAQESGRAGRDGKDSYCYSAGFVSRPELVPQMLDTSRPLEERRKEFESLGLRDDLTTLLYFHYKNFGGITSDLKGTEEVFSILKDFKAGVPNILSYPSEAEARDNFERGLYRLTALGVVEDYEIDYGSNAATIYVSKYSLAILKSRALEFLDRLEPGKSAIHEEQVDAAPKNTSEAVSYLLELMLTTHYSIIEPARLRAIQAMYELTFRSLSGEEIANEIEEYLSSGPLREALNSLIQSSSVEASEVLSALELIQLSDASEWIGASTRLLEAFPNHPVLLYSRLIGELLLKEPNSSNAASLFGQLYIQLFEYGVSPEGALLLHNKLNDVILGLSDAQYLVMNLTKFASGEYGLVSNSSWENHFLMQEGHKEAYEEFTNLILAKRSQALITSISTFAQEKNR